MRVTQRNWAYLGQVKENPERFKHRRERDFKMAKAVCSVLLNVEVMHAEEKNIHYS